MMKPQLQGLLDDWKRRRWEAFHIALGIDRGQPILSKYRRKPGEGKCALGMDTGLRKYGRLIARGLAGPSEAALNSAHDRRYKYKHSHARYLVTFPKSLVA